MDDEFGAREKMEGELDALKDELADLADDILETNLLGQQTRSDIGQSPLFNARLSRLDSTHEKFLAVFNRIRRYSKSLNVPLLDSERLKARVRSAFYEALSLGNTTLPRPPRSDQERKISNGNIKENHNNLRLPIVNIPSFSGRICDWPSYRDTFLSLIHENESLSDIERFHYLKSSLEGPAAQIVSTIGLSAQGYKQAWEALNKKYENKKLQATFHLMNIFNFTPISRSSLSSLELFASQVMESATSFFKLHLTDPAGFILTAFAMRLLDTRTRERFESEFGSHSEPPTWADFSDFVHKQIIQLQSSSLTTTVKTQSSSLDARYNKGPKQISLSVNASSNARTTNLTSYS